MPASAVAFSGTAAEANPATTTSSVVHAHLSTTRVGYDRELAVRGELPAGDAGDRLALQFQTDGTARWRTLASTTARSTGAFAFRAPLVRSGFVRVTGGAPARAERASADSTSGGAAPYAIAPSATPLDPSPAERVEVGARFAVASGVITGVSGEPIAVAGRLLPGTPGRTVTLTTRSGSGWETLATTRTGLGGHFTLHYVIPGTGTRYLRVGFAGDRENATAWSEAGELVGMRDAVASWYDDAGNTACGFHATDGVANKTLPCGTKVTFSYGGRTVVATVDDRGPYVAGRDYDLNQNTAAALGMSGVATVLASV